MVASGGRVAERHRRAGFLPNAVRFGKHVDIVINSAGDVELIAGWREGEAAESIRHLQDLRLLKAAMGHIKDEHILVRVGSNLMALVIVESIKAAGKNQQRVSVGTHRRLDRLTDGIARKILKSRVEL